MASSAPDPLTPPAAYSLGCQLLNQRDFANAMGCFFVAIQDRSFAEKLAQQGETLAKAPLPNRDPELLLNLGNALHIMQSDVLGRLGMFFQAEGLAQAGKPKVAADRLKVLMRDLPVWQRVNPHHAQPAQEIYERAHARLQELTRG